MARIFRRDQVVILIFLLALFCARSATSEDNQGVYRNNLKNREFDKEASQIPDSSDYFGIVRFLYVRHAEVFGNIAHPSTRAYTGCATNDSLTATGCLQAEECARRISALQKSGVFGKITALYASNLKRAIETAGPIAQQLGLPVRVRQDLREIDWGCADGQLVEKIDAQYAQKEEEIEHLYPERKIRWDYLPIFEGAETYNELLKRTLGELKKIAQRHAGETVLIVGHGRALKALIIEARNSEENIPKLGNCTIAAFTYSPKEGLCFLEVVEENKN